MFDQFCPADRPRIPGAVADPHFHVVTCEPASWERAFARNPGNETRIEPLIGWRHLGFGRIVAIDPIRLDLGILMLELDLPDELLVDYALAGGPDTASPRIQPLRATR